MRFIQCRNYDDHENKAYDYSREWAVEKLAEYQEFLRPYAVEYYEALKNADLSTDEGFDAFMDSKGNSTLRILLIGLNIVSHDDGLIETPMLYKPRYFNDDDDLIATIPLDYFGTIKVYKDGTLQEGY